MWPNLLIASALRFLQILQETDFQQVCGLQIRRVCAQQPSRLLRC